MISRRRPCPEWSEPSGEQVRSVKVMLIAVLVMTSLALVSCGDDGDSKVAFESVLTRALAPGAPLPEASDPALVVRGPDGNELAALDVETLDKLGTVRATVYERWFKRDVTFDGPWVADVLDAVDPSGHGPVLLSALDDYEATIDRADLRVGDALLATYADGAPIPVAEGGPLRLVFLDDKDPIGANEKNWIWSVNAIQVR